MLSIIWTFSVTYVSVSGGVMLVPVVDAVRDARLAEIRGAQRLAGLSSRSSVACL